MIQSNSSMSKRIKLPNVGDLIHMSFHGPTLFYVTKRIRVKNKILGKWKAFYYYHLRYILKNGIAKLHYESRTSEDIQMFIRTRQWKVTYVTRKRRLDTLSGG